MSDAPETIWAVHWNTEGAVVNGAWADTVRHFGGGVEYRRADLPPTTAQIMTDPRVKALVEALEKIQLETVRCRGDQSYRDTCKMAFSVSSQALAQIKEPKP